jgi:hypothetical protein
MKSRSLIINVSIVLALILTALPVSTILSVSAGEVANLLTNGDFEDETAGWEGIDIEHLTKTAAHSGDYSLLITDAREAISEWIPVIPGKAYELSAWYRWDALYGFNWGFDRILVSEFDHRQLALVRDMHLEHQPGTWNEVTLTFIPQTSLIRINLGLFGPQDHAFLYFDDIVLREINSETPTSTPIDTETPTSIPASTETVVVVEEPSPQPTETAQAVEEPTPVVIQTETPDDEPPVQLTATPAPETEPTTALTETAVPAVTATSEAEPTFIPEEPTPEPEPVMNLMINSGFEDGNFGWDGLAPYQLIEDDVHNGRLAVQIFASQEARQGWLQVIPGETYLLTAWVKWIEFEGKDWGYSRIRVDDASWGKVAEITNLHKLADQNQWTQIKLQFTPATDIVMISFGVFGPKEQARLLFDDFSLSVQGDEPVEEEPTPLPPSQSLKITSPTDSAYYETDASSIVIGGVSNAAASVVWDNVDTDAAGIVSNTGSIDTWQTNSIQLKPGHNELFFTAMNAEGVPETARIVVNRRSSGPSIFNIEGPPA